MIRYFFIKEIRGDNPAFRKFIYKEVYSIVPSVTLGEDIDKEPIPLSV